MKTIITILAVLYLAYAIGGLLGLAMYYGLSGVMS